MKGPQEEDLNLEKRWHYSLEGLEMGHRSSTFKSRSLHTANNNTEKVRFHFGLKGDYRFEYVQLGKKYDLIGGHHNIMYSQGITLHIENKSDLVETFGIDFSPWRFIALLQDINPLVNQFIDKIVNGQSAILSDRWGTVTATIQKTIFAMMHHPYQGRMAEIYLMSKVMELLVLCIDNYQKINRTHFAHIKSAVDQERIMLARDILADHLDNPLRLSELAKKVGLNEFKLKHGFKELFGTTPFRYLTQLRLDHAKFYLESGDLTIDQIATKLGYSSTPHFHQQFKRQYGVTPNSIRKAP